MTLALRMLCAAGCLAAPPAVAGDEMDGARRIAAHFEALSSRLLPEDTIPLRQFVANVGNEPGAKLAILIPDTADPSRARFVLARVAELERRIRSLAETAEVRKVQGNASADTLWLVLIPRPLVVEKKPVAVELLPPPERANEVATRSTENQSSAPLSAADLRLADWVVRGVKHPSQGPTYAYVSKIGSAEAPHEITEQKTDKELGFVRDISLSPEGSWIVHTEIGWIGQDASARSAETGSH